jgi:hypothetical protein
MISGRVRFLLLLDGFGAGGVVTPSGGGLQLTVAKSCEGEVFVS